MTGLAGIGWCGLALGLIGCAGSPAPAAPAAPAAPPAPEVPPTAVGDPRASLVSIPGARYLMGDPQGEPNEAPARVAVAPFRLMRYEVTNAQFARFVAETGYVTDAERHGGSLWRGRRWRWKQTGVDWRHPHGPGSSIAGPGYPVVQVSWRDARAFCGHYGMRLPSEAEWELAARGTDGRRYVWGDDPPAAGARRGNLGTLACCAVDASDGYERLAPVGRYPAGVSPYGLWDMVGNVWEWTADPYPGRPHLVTLRGAGWANSAWCRRAAYRHMNPPDRGLEMVGIRCAAAP